MAVWGYECYLLVLRERYFQHLKIKFVSPSRHLISSIYMPDVCTTLINEN